MTEALILALKSGLSLWQSKESRKYMDKTISLEKEYYDESNKNRPDMARLDNIDFELRLIGKAFSAELGKSNSVD